MSGKENARNSNLRPVTKIIAGYLSNHAVAPDQLSTLIVSVEQTVRRLGRPTETRPARPPAVPVKQSVRHDFVICLECGFRAKTLRRHLGTRHGLQTIEYLRRWRLPNDHPLTAPAYSEQRSTMAKELGLGRRRRRPAAAARRPAAADRAGG